MSRVRIYLNENLSWRISRALSGYGYDVISSHDIDMNSESDDSQLEFAVSQGRAVVTNNFCDFSELHKEYVGEKKKHYGIVFTTKCSLSLMIRRLRNLMDQLSGEELINQIRWLNEFDDESET